MFKLIVLIFFLGCFYSNFAQNVANTLTVEVSNIQNSKGFIMLEIKDENAGTIDRVRLKTTQPITIFTFSNLKSGKYAVAVYHDENSNEKIDTNIWGVPEELYGFSNNVRGTFGPPSLEKQLFELHGAVIINIQLK